MDVWKSLTGTYCIEILSAAPTETLTLINNNGIILFDVCYVDELTIRAGVSRKSYKILRKLLVRRGEKVKIVKRNGIFWAFHALKKRPVLVAGLIFYLFMILYLPTRVFFVSVEGNITVPTRLILEKAEACGIEFGASRRNVRSEKVKNALLESVSQLQWTGINTSGCTAVISVRERSGVQIAPETKGVGSVIAKTDGIITDITVLRGNPLCRVGQAVKSGQVLVSGYTDCGLTVKAEIADAEIFAQTHHTITAVTPAVLQERGTCVQTKRNFGLLIGKKLINFTKDSGISDASCVKMYKEYYLTLPGGFQLPVALVVEELSYYSQRDSAEENDFSWMKDSLKSYLEGQMVAGKIIHTESRVSVGQELCSTVGEYDCIEMIGQVRSEEIIQGNGERD